MPRLTSGLTSKAGAAGGWDFRGCSGARPAAAEAGPCRQPPRAARGVRWCRGSAISAASVCVPLDWGSISNNGCARQAVRWRRRPRHARATRQPLTTAMSAGSPARRVEGARRLPGSTPAARVIEQPRAAELTSISAVIGTVEHEHRDWPPSPLIGRTDQVAGPCQKFVPNPAGRAAAAGFAAGAASCGRRLSGRRALAGRRFRGGGGMPGCLSAPSRPVPGPPGRGSSPALGRRSSADRQPGTRPGGWQIERPARTQPSGRSAAPASPGCRQAGGEAGARRRLRAVPAPGRSTGRPCQR